MRFKNNVVFRNMELFIALFSIFITIMISVCVIIIYAPRLVSDILYRNNICVSALFSQGVRNNAKKRY